MPMLVLVNLDAASERRRHMVAQFDALELRYRRVGIDGRTRTTREIAALCAERFPGIAFDLDFLSGAEVGCWLSHLSAWALLRAERSYAACVVVEDDVRLDPGFPAAVAALRRAMPFDIVYLGTSSRNVSARRRVRVGEWSVHEPVGTILNTWGYVVSRAYVERFLAAHVRRIRLPIDHFIGSGSREPAPRIGVLHPPVVREDAALAARSQIEPHTFRPDRWRLVEALRRRLLAGPIGSMYASLYRWL
ncbi:MAG: glycosyltransferase family 25 protein [Betaproteobacteria bacterium]|nr:glycosyltransferase family 25 protein [Betaproteobacteria bacterium]